MSLWGLYICKDTALRALRPRCCCRWANSSLNPNALQLHHISQWGQEQLGRSKVLHKDRVTEQRTGPSNLSHRHSFRVPVHDVAEGSFEFVHGVILGGSWISWPWYRRWRRQNSVWLNVIKKMLNVNDSLKLLLKKHYSI